MTRWLKRALMRGYRIPPDPRPPAGSDASVRVFRAARNYYRFALLRWGFRQLGAVIGIVFVLSIGWDVTSWFSIDSRRAAEIVDELPRPLVAVGEWLGVIEAAPPTADGSPQTLVVLGPLLFGLEMFGIGLFLLQLPLTYAMVRLDYELRWYIVTDRSLRIREGVASIRETTMTFANIQNISIREGPAQRLFGIADLQVRTAGGGSKGEEGESGEHGGGDRDLLHIAYFRGVDNAAELRDTILGHLRSLEDAGLGDLDGGPVFVTPAAPLEAALKVLEEARAMRAALGARGGAEPDMLP